MKKIILAIAIIALVANNSIAQENGTDFRKKFQIGVKAGANYSNIYDTKNNKVDAENKFGFVGGVFIAIPIGKFLGIQPEILFSQKGYKQTGTFLGSNYDLTRTTDYIDIPLLVSIKPIKCLTIQAGPQYSYLIKQKNVFTSPVTSIEQQEEFKNENIRKNTLCFIGGFDVNIKRITLGARAGWDVQNNNGDGTSTAPRYKNAWTQLTLGFRLL